MHVHVHVLKTSTSLCHTLSNLLRRLFFLGVAFLIKVCVILMRRGNDTVRIEGVLLNFPFTFPYNCHRQRQRE